MKPVCQNEPSTRSLYGSTSMSASRSSQGKPLFVLHDGPPYPTEKSPGTGLNKSSRLVSGPGAWQGLRSYVPDGLPRLPIETQVEKELAERKVRR